MRAALSRVNAVYLFFGLTKKDNAPKYMYRESRCEEYYGMVGPVTVEGAGVPFLGAVTLENTPPHLEQWGWGGNGNGMGPRCYRWWVSGTRWARSGGGRWCTDLRKYGEANTAAA